MRSMLLTAASFFGVAALAGTATAAPQVLLLVATGDEVALLCERGECVAEVTTICVQPDRDNPARGTRYTVLKDPGGGDALSLLGRTLDGREVTLPAEANLHITAERGHAAVRLSVPQATLQRFGLAGVAVRIARHAALAPIAVEGDPRPQTLADLSLVRNTLRPMAENVIELHSGRVTVARLIRDVINALPRERRTSGAEREAAWRRALGSEAARVSDRIPDRALRRARDAFATCGSITASANWSHYRFRSCLGDMHDRIMGTVNTEYRKALNFGS